jgi:hypothetical protein
VVKIELTAPGREDSIYVELPQARFAELGLPSTGDEVFVVPRNLRVFVEDYQI